MWTRSPLRPSWISPRQRSVTKNHYRRLMTRTQIESLYLDHTVRQFWGPLGDETASRTCWYSSGQAVLIYSRVHLYWLISNDKCRGGLGGVVPGEYDTKENNDRQFLSVSCRQPFHFGGTSSIQPLKKTCKNFQLILECLFGHFSHLRNAHQACVVYMWYSMR